MTAKRKALTTFLSLGLLVAPGPGSLDLDPGPGEIRTPLVGIEEAYGAKCTESVCVTVDLKLIAVTLCRSREYDC
ncbi:MAG TPA: hypothetical protein VM737_09220 [Gemmatimonadota bacterium]|nr:hypothetical protein [Gemmatimonadota bacterium]